MDYLSLTTREAFIQWVRACAWHRVIFISHDDFFRLWDWWAREDTGRDETGPYFVVDGVVRARPKISPAIPAPNPVPLDVSHRPLVETINEAIAAGRL